nr:family 43 glycosylhydrolase [Actinocrispum wychmicini]
MVALLAVSAALVSACSNSQPQAERAGGAAFGGAEPRPKGDHPGPRPLGADSYRAEGNVVAAAGENAQYNYAPSLMADGGRVRMWWCSQLVSAPPPGDDVLYAEAPAPNGPFDAGRAVFSGSGNGFDARHTCDPSVLRVNGTYYLYYTGASTDHSGNAIGVATSTDGVTWARANGGRPVVSSSYEVSRGNPYGAGQPSVVFLDGWYYLLFTDTNGRAAGPNGAGQFVLRSPDPMFASGVESLGDHGFRPGMGRDRTIVDAFSADWMWVAALNSFAIAHEADGGTSITFWNRDFTANPYQPVLVAGPWEEGPGLVRRPDGHAPVDPRNPCGRIPVDLVRATRDRAEPTDLQHFGLTLNNPWSCENSAAALATLNGFAVPGPQRTVDLVLAGQLFRIDRKSVAEAIGATVIGARPAAMDNVKPAARVIAGVQALRAQGRGIGLLVDGQLYPVASAAVAAANSSPVVDVAPALWDGYSVGPALTVSR